MKILKYGLVLIILFFAAGCILYFEKWSEDLRFAGKLGAGINIGNSLDATGLRKHNPEALDLDYETFWNDEPITEQMFGAISNAGFKTVRIPVTWEDHLDEDGDISETWMKRVETVVKYALRENLYVIINLHHEGWLDLKPEKEEEFSVLFKKVWKQISSRFASYDERLIFESMNEPRLRNSNYEWSGGTSGLRDTVNRLNHIFVETVRSTGGNNKKRYLMIAPYASNHAEEALSNFDVTKSRLIVSVHIYVPYDFCQNQSGTKKWNSEDIEDKKDLINIFENIEKHFLKKGIPVSITEFGCMDKNNPEERENWTGFFVQEAKKRNIPYIWWDNGSNYALLNRKSNTWIYPNLIKTLTK